MRILPSTRELKSPNARHRQVVGFYAAQRGQRVCVGWDAIHGKQLFEQQLVVGRQMLS